MKYSVERYRNEINYDFKNEKLFEAILRTSKLGGFYHFGKTILFGNEKYLWKVI